MLHSPYDIDKSERVIIGSITTQRSGHAFFITLNRPEKRNGFTRTDHFSKYNCVSQALLAYRRKIALDSAFRIVKAYYVFLPKN
jgi:hypothetical protein